MVCLKTSGHSHAFEHSHREQHEVRRVSIRIASAITSRRHNIMLTTDHSRAALHRCEHTLWPMCVVVLSSGKADVQRMKREQSLLQRAGAWRRSTATTSSRPACGEPWMKMSCGSCQSTFSGLSLQWPSQAMVLARICLGSFQTR